MSNILESICMQKINSEHDRAQKISKFLHSGIPEMTMKFVSEEKYGEEVIRLQKYKGFIEEWKLMEEVKKWIKTGTAQKELFNYAGSPANKIGAAIEM